MEMTRARIFRELALGRLDMTGSAINTPERAVYAWFANYVTLKNYAIFRTSVVNIASAEDILKNQSLVIGIVRGFRHDPAIDDLIATVRAQDPRRIVEVVDQDTLYKMLLVNQVQVVFGQPTAYAFHFKKLGITETQTIDIAPKEGTVDAGLALSKTTFSEEEARKWQAIVAEMRADGTMRMILEKYVSPSEAARILAF
jgi:polar amino acid transport system substrate-binding protein